MKLLKVLSVITIALATTTADYSFASKGKKPEEAKKANRKKVLEEARKSVETSKAVRETKAAGKVVKDITTVAKGEHVTPSMKDDLLALTTGEATLLVKAFKDIPSRSAAQKEQKENAANFLEIFLIIWHAVPDAEKANFPLNPEAATAFVKDQIAKKDQDQTAAVEFTNMLLGFWKESGRDAKLSGDVIVAIQKWMETNAKDYAISDAIKALPEYALLQIELGREPGWWDLFKKLCLKRA